MKYIYDIIMMSISSSIMYIVAQLIYKNIHKKYARWYYAMLITSVFMLFVPLERIIRLPKMLHVTVPQSAEVYDVIPHSAVTGVSRWQIIFVTWILVTLIMMLCVGIKYIRTCYVLRRISTVTDDKAVLNIYDKIFNAMGLRHSIEIRQSADIVSPLTFGIIKRVILLPKRDFSDLELEMIMAHELIHCKHYDIFIKLITSLSVCVHWFNPVVYMLARSVNNACELCCDEAVLDMLDPDDKKVYGRLIISVIEDSLNKSFSYTTAMASTERGIKQRLRRIVEFKRPSIAVKITGVMVMAAVCTCSVTAFGVDFAKKALPEKAVEIIEKIEETAVIEAVVTPAPTAEPVPLPTATVRSNRVVTSPTAKPTYAPTTSPTERPTDASVILTTESPEAEQSTPTPLRPSETPRPTPHAPERTLTPKESERNTSVGLEIDESENFDDEKISNGGKVYIKANASDELKGEVGASVKAYVRINEDGSFDIMSTEIKETNDRRK